MAGVIAGSYLDGYLGSDPWMTLLLTVGAMAGALYRLIWMLKRFGSESADGGS